jgi:hypothetical protein
MQPASQRSTRSNVTIQVGAMSVSVNVYSGTFTPPSPKSFCKGTEGHAHEAQEVKSRGRYCPVCLDNSESAVVIGEVVQAYKSDSGALVPVGADAQAERLLDVAPLRDVMDVRSVEKADFALRFVESGNIYWLVPNDDQDANNYLGLLQAIEEDGLVLVTVWASRTVAKPYRVGVHAGMLTLTELVPESTLRAAPADPPEGDAKKIQQARRMFALAASETASPEEVEQLAIDPGRDALRRAANAAEAQGAESLKIERGERVTFAARAAEADLTALLDADLLS